MGTFTQQAPKTSNLSRFEGFFVSLESLPDVLDVLETHTEVADLPRRFLKFSQFLNFSNRN
jgi:hypothetical protein